jgi:CheY-like chemotaxis protein
MSETAQTLQRELHRAHNEIEQLRHQLRQSRADAERGRQKLGRELQEFARELRVPLTSVLGFTDLLSVTHRGNPTELNQIAKAGHQLMSLVADLEKMAAISIGPPSAGSDEPPPQIVEENSVVRKILHIEDNETNFRLVERILEDRANLQLLWACNGTEGMSFALDHSPSLILLDLNLPDIHGGELIAKLKGHPQTKTIPVIVLSADISPSQIERMLQAGARNYLTKPFDIKRLLCLVDETLAPAIATT